MVHPSKLEVNVLLDDDPGQIERYPEYRRLLDDYNRKIAMSLLIPQNFLNLLNNNEEDENMLLNICNYKDVIAYGDGGSPFKVLGKRKLRDDLDKYQYRINEELNKTFQEKLWTRGKNDPIWFPCREDVLDILKNIKEEEKNRKESKG